MYDMPNEIQVEADGPLRIITLNRPEELNAVNDDLHVGLARIWNRLSLDPTARVAVITGAGKAFSAGGDFNYIKELSEDVDLRTKTIIDGREIVMGMVRCRIPVIAAVNGPAVGLGCSVVALSDIVYMGEKAFLADPHVQVGLVAADGGPLVWPMQMSILQAKEYALTGARIPAQKAVELGNRLAEQDKDADVWDIASGLLAGAVQFWLYSRQPCGDPTCESCDEVSTAALRLAELLRETNTLASKSPDVTIRS